MIKYLGSKRMLLPAILAVVREALQASGADADHATVADLFSGTSRVGHALKRAGYRVLANDHNAYAATLAACYVQADAGDVLADAGKLVEEFNRLPGAPGYFTQTFCERARYLTPRNGERVDAIRDELERKALDPELHAVMLTSLMEAADRVDSTTGLQMAYLKSWAPRARNDLCLRVPDVLPRAAAGKGAAHRLDASEAAGTFDADVAYLDPPYNQHSYLGNYHVWESLARWDKPEVYGVACKRVDVKLRRSAFNSRPGFAQALGGVLRALRAPAIVLSFSNEGFIARAEVEAMLGGLWGGSARVRTLGFDANRYVGAKIGIYNPAGKKVGKVGHLRNTEYLYLATREGAGRAKAPVGPVLAEPAHSGTA